MHSVWQYSNLDTVYNIQYLLVHSVWQCNNTVPVGCPLDDLDIVLERLLPLRPQ
jgi:hypothetical protein